MSENKKSYKCPFCSKKYIEKQALYSHMEREHKEQLEGLPAAQIYFNITHNKSGGKCIICKSPTEFNLKTEKYERLCNNPKCKEEFRKKFLENMKKAGKENQMNDPEHQKKMLANRKISGTYVWSSNKAFKFIYTALYEKDFLMFMDLFVNWNPSDLFMPCPFAIKYKYKNKWHNYLPDAFIPSLNLIIEIKASDNHHYRERDIEIEKAKDKYLDKFCKENSYYYFKVFDKQYDDLFNYIMKLILNNNEE